MKCLNSICIKYLKNNKDKVWTAIASVMLTTFFVVTILAFSNGIGRHLEEKYEILGENFVLIESSGYSEEIAGYLEQSKFGKVNIASAITLFESISDTVSVVENIIVTNSEEMCILDEKYEYNTLRHGRFFSEYEEMEGKKVAIIDDRLANALFRTELVIGKEINICGYAYRIIGVIENIDEKSDKDFEDNIERIQGYVYIPRKSITVDSYQNGMSRYHIELCNTQVNNVIEDMEEKLNIQTADYNIISSSSINEEITDIISNIKKVLICATTFSICISIMVLISTVRLILLDLKKTILYFYMLGIRQSSVEKMLIIITMYISLLGSLIGIILSTIIQALINVIFQFPAYILATEIMAIFLLDVIVSVIVCICIRKTIGKIKVMELFRN